MPLMYHDAVEAFANLAKEVDSLFRVRVRVRVRGFRVGVRVRVRVGFRARS